MASPAPAPLPPLHHVSSTTSEKVEGLEGGDIANNAGQSQDEEQGQEYSDRVLLDQRSWMETVVLCFANLIPPLGVALSTRDCSKVTVALLLTCCFYIPGLIYAFACISRRGTGRWSDSPCTLGL
ncbi:hypothetical protein P389DRAFT_197243 [Cystobasidium minutum MCA 4210]|uniref:uncharacterized protein n=1 Tax=Cystobasidium minutum MCA 4210 TaxID=1397322 RepID=UPI0034CD2EDC|eukprot:jgi/Rhomi1/197243/gm1.5457_g